MNVLVTGGAGYIGSQTAKTLKRGRPRARRARQPGLRPQVGGAVGPARARATSPTARPARRASTGTRSTAVDPLRRRRLRRRVGDRPAQVLPEQHVQHAEPAGRDGRARRRATSCSRRRAPPTASRSAFRSTSRTRRPGQPVRRVEAVRRAHPALVRRRRTACAPSRCATSTRRARIPDGDDRRGPRSRDAPDPARHRRGARERPPVGVFGTDYPTPDGTAIRDYIHVMDLADAHVRGAGLPAGRRREHRHQPRHGSRPLGARGDRGGRAGGRTGGPAHELSRAAPAIRRSSSPMPVVRRTSSAGRRATPTCATIIEHAWRWHTRNLGPSTVTVDR